ncbi:MAG: lysophospholipase [Solirubrobacteraceae bacterium]
MRNVAGRFAGSGGLGIHWQSWWPDDPPRGSLVIAHGAAEHGGRYAPLAAQLVDWGFCVYAIDHRGHGLSEGRRSVIDRRTRAVADLQRVIAHATSEQDGRLPFLLGHSMGGCLALDVALGQQDRLAGLILSGPLVELDTPRALLAVSRVLSALVPRLGVYAVEAAATSRDPEQVRRYEEDPLNYRGKLPVRTVAELAGAIASFPSRVPALRLPLLILQGGADQIVPPSGARMIADRAGSEDLTLRVYPDLRHEIFHEAEPERSAVIADLANWLDRHVRTKPAAARSWRD